jgi:predicted membrane-bound spermidine synthase
MASQFAGILAEGAIALSVVLSGGAPLANRNIIQFPSSLIANVMLAPFMLGVGPTKQIA